MWIPGKHGVPALEPGSWPEAVRTFSDFMKDFKLIGQVAAPRSINQNYFLTIS
jgi:hypothetical protein